MKLTKLAKLCKDAGGIHLYQDEGSSIQWAGTRAAVYPLHNIRLNDAPEAKFVFDIPRKDFDTFPVSFHTLPEGLCFKDADPRENPIEDYLFNLEIPGGLVRPVRTQRGLVFYDPRYLDPIADEVYTLYERISDDGIPYIAAKAGMFIVGIIMPRIPHDEKLGGQLLEVASMYANNYMTFAYQDEEEGELEG